MRAITAEECLKLEALGNYCDDWSMVEVCEDFSPEQIRRSRLSGKVIVASGAKIENSSVCNYSIGRGSTIESVTALECRHSSCFGNGVMVATMNECEGRKVKIFDRLSSQLAYILAIFRHRPQTIARLEEFIDKYAENQRSTIGRVGAGCKIRGARFIREVNIGDGVTIDGVSALENGTICNDSVVGVDVKAYDFIIAEGAEVDNGAIIQRCFVGESVILDKAFSASESLFFANSHCENGEAASIFAGPYTVSHHKSSLLIAGMFSFFNAGSGSNQSNHLFKSGAVHQSVHLRGCKFASGAYIMSPALEGAFTMILGHHSFHHDTSEFPYSYLIEKDGRSMLMPGANLTSYGAVRDIEKWPQRDKRRLKRDRINFEEYNPYICQSMVSAVNVLNILREQEPDAETYTYKKVFIRSTLLARGIRLYNKAIVASLGMMLSKGSCRAECDGSGRWIDMAGQYILRSYVEQLLDDVDGGSVLSLDEVEERLSRFLGSYDDYAHSWAVALYGELLGRRPTEQDIDEAVDAGKGARKAMRQTTENDRLRDCSLEMAISYGLESGEDDVVREDFHNVRGLK